MHCQAGKISSRIGYLVVAYRLVHEGVEEECVMERIFSKVRHDYRHRKVTSNDGTGH